MQAIAAKTSAPTGAEAQLAAAAPPAPPTPQATEPALALPADQSSCCSTASGKTSYGKLALGGSVALAVPLALYGGWDWLVATGLAAVLIGVAPCLLMCALGLCMARKGKAPTPALADTAKTYETPSGEPPRHS